QLSARSLLPSRHSGTGGAWLSCPFDRARLLPGLRIDGTVAHGLQACRPALRKASCPEDSRLRYQDFAVAAVGGRRPAGARRVTWFAQSIAGRQAAGYTQPADRGLRIR